MSYYIIYVATYYIQHTYNMGTCTHNIYVATYTGTVRTRTTVHTYMYTCLKLVFVYKVMYYADCTKCNSIQSPHNLLNSLKINT
jgi:hypothetical protein